MWFLILIGKILLWFFLTLVLLVLFVLFLPIQYKINATKSESEIFVKGKASWFFGIIRILFDYPKDKSIKLKILFFQINKKKEKNIKVKKEKKKKVKPPKREKEIAGVNLSLMEDNNEIRLQATEASNLSENDTISEEKSTKKTNTNNNPENIPLSINSGESAEEKKKQNIFHKIKAFIEKIQYTIKSLYDKITHIKEEIEFYKKLWEEPITRSFMTDSFFRVFKVLKKILPQKVRLNAHIGTGSCDTTGYMMAAYGIISTIIPRKYIVTLEPDFEQTVIEGSASIKGHITVFHIFVCGLQLIFDKRLRALNKKIKAHKAKNKHVQESTGTE